MATTNINANLHVNLKSFVERNLCKEFNLAKLLKTSGMLYPRRIEMDVYLSEIINDGGDEVKVSIIGDFSKHTVERTVWDLYFLQKDVDIARELVDAINGDL